MGILFGGLFAVAGMFCLYLAVALALTSVGGFAGLAVAGVWIWYTMRWHRKRREARAAAIPTSLDK